MAQSHAVQALRFELQASTAAQAHRLHDRISALCQQKLPTVLTEELTAHCPPGVQLELPELVLELPPLADRHLEAELPDLLRQALRAALAQLLPPAADALGPAAPLSVLGIIEYFLLHGRLPWQVNVASFSLEAALREALTQHAAAFRALVVRLGRAAAVRQRLVWQLSAEQLARLITLLEPAHAAFLHEYLLTTLAAHRRQPLAPVTDTTLRRIIYELILTDLLTQAGTAFNRRAFVERQIYQLAARHNLSFGELLRQLADLQTPLAFAAQSALPALIRELYRAETGRSNRAETWQRQAQAPTAAATLLLPAALVTGHPTASASVALGTLTAAAGGLANVAAGNTKTGNIATNATAGSIARANASASSAAAANASAGNVATRAAAGAAASQSQPAAENLANNHSVAAQASAAGATKAAYVGANLTPTQAGNAAGPTPMATDRLPHPGGVLDAAAAQLSAAQTLAPVQAMAADLEYFLRYGSLPLTPGRLVSFAQLQEVLVALLAQNWPLLRKIARQAGSGAAQRLARHFPEPILQQLLRRAVAGQVRPFLATMEAVLHSRHFLPAAARPTRPALWEHTLAYLLRDSPTALSSPAFGQWLTQQLPAAPTSPFTPEPELATGFSAAAPLTPEREVEVLQHYLRHGTMPEWWEAGPVATPQLRRLFARIAGRNPRPIREFVRAQADTPAVLRHLAQLADFPQLARLLGVGGAPRTGRARRAWQLLADVEQLLTATTLADGSVRLPEFLRAAYVAFHLQSRTNAVPTAALRQLAAAHQLPWRAVLGKVAGLALLRPALGLEPFFAALLAAYRAEYSFAEPTAASTAIFSRHTSSTVRQLARAAGANITSLTFSTLAAAGIPAADLAAATTAIPPAASSPVSSKYASAAAGATTSAAAATVAVRVGSTGAEWQKAWFALAPGRSRPPLSSGQLLALQPAAGTRELILHYLLRGSWPAWWHQPPMAPAHLRQLLARVSRQSPAAVRTFVRQHAATPAVRLRLATLADFPLLTRLLASQPGRPQRAAPALAVLDRSEAHGTPPQPSRWLLFLRTAYLAFHGPARRQNAAALLTETQRLAAAHGLPWQALLSKVSRLLSQQPLLQTDPFFASLQQAMRQRVRLSEKAVPPARLPGRSSSAQPAGARPGADLAAGGGGRYLAADQPGARPGAGRTAAAPEPGRLDELGAAYAAFSPERPRLNEAGSGSLFPAAEPAARLAQLPTGAAARDLIFHLLLYQELPWWAPDGLSITQQRLLLTQVAHYYRAALQALVRAHHREPKLLRILATLADFTLLTQLTGSPARAGAGPDSRPVLAQLDQLLTREATRAGAPLLRFLKEAYLDFAARPRPTSLAQVAAEVRRRAASQGVSGWAVLQQVAWLQRQLPALATAPFFAALLAAHAAQEQVRRSRPRPSVAQRRPRQSPPLTSAAVPDATLAYQALEHYLHTGQLPGPPARFAGKIGPVGSAPTTGARAEVPPGQGDAALKAALLLWKPLLRAENRLVLQKIRPLLASATVRGRLLEGLREADFWQLLRQLYLAHYRLAASLVGDWQLLARQGVVRLRAPALFDVLLTLIQATPVASWRPETLLSALLAAEEQLWPQAALAPGQSRAGLVLREAARRGLVLRSPLGALLTVRHEALTAAAAKKAAPPSDPIPFAMDEPQPLETVYIANAGLVLLWPFLTMLFDRLGYLESQQFHDEAAQQQAALLLQFLASGAADVPEYALPLNKLLCGIRQPRPLPRELLLTDAEKELGESLLKAVIARWEILKNTSVAGLRETFLLRSGKLDWLEERIVLTVEPKSLDILLDQRPWSISIIKLPWMAAPLYVTWR